MASIAGAKGGFSPRYCAYLLASVADEAMAR
jgi:hypothetical protein